MLHYPNRLTVGEATKARIVAALVIREIARIPHSVLIRVFASTGGCMIGWCESNRQKLLSRIFNGQEVQNLCVDTSSASVKYLASRIML